MTKTFINENFNKEIEELNRIKAIFKEDASSNLDSCPIIEREKFKTKAGKELYDLLIQISNDNLFLLNIFAQLKGDEKKHQLIEYLKKEKRKEYQVSEVADRINIGIWGLTGEEIYDKFNSTDIDYRLFHLLEGIDFIINGEDKSKINYEQICRIMSLMETQEEREMLINTIDREIEKRELNLKDFIDLIYLCAQNYYDEKHSL
jgi:hypothetical protein